MEMKDITELLLDHDIKPSYPRLRIYKFLDEYRVHPTVDCIFTELTDEIPTLSKTTIYNTLKLFEDSSLVASINVGENEKRYEVVDHEHAHFKCESCNEIFDIPYALESMLSEEYKDFTINKKEIFLSGLCSKCKDN